MRTKGLFIIAFITAQLALYAQPSTQFGVEFAGRSNGSVYSGDNESEINDMLGRNFGLGFGLNVVHSISSSTAINIGVMYDQRGYRVTSEESNDDYIDLFINYLDFPILVHLFFSSDSGTASVRPYAFIGAVPGVFMSGKASLVIDGETVETTTVESESITSFNLALKAGLGLDIPVSSSVSMSVRLGYEYGVTDVNPEEDTSSEVSERFNTIVGSIALTFRL